ncbi:hypothetical protein [Halothiobacillus neapolitanus]|uniref:Lipoprotein n=1 Tax=Halothiobacillus neapolitanus (strain ATCC 23641 / DSM 15147 / CIP 104769 / NCIMB 8539 / c2) TaxID=555778 RepID=D0KWX2_HALNC|nr:hypothetical protein [Halothiobacillus neapolitanus]ACX97092.1 hypothetical protein Hneap_2278 [Halothiobacillus neapolitanus c2]TDN58038.1 hypothetical protein C8D83_10915 [Halothiobacillus neapolitanus]
MRPLTFLTRSLFLLALLSLAGCLFNNGPDKDSVRQILQDQLDPSGKVIVVERIDSLNSAEQDQKWAVDVAATLVFKQSAEQVAKSLQSADSANSLLGTVGQIGLMLQFGNFKAGQTQTYHSRLQLLKGSSGWMPVERK